jgi:hypothetical protein
VWKFVTEPENGPVMVRVSQARKVVKANVKKGDGNVEKLTNVSMKIGFVTHTQIVMTVVTKKTAPRVG